MWETKREMREYRSSRDKERKEVRKIKNKKNILVHKGFGRTGGGGKQLSPGGVVEKGR